MKLHDALKNEDCIGQKVTADIPVGLEWVDYPENYAGGIISPEAIEVHKPNNTHRDVYTEDGLLAFCQGETCEIKGFDEKNGTVTLLNNDPARSLSTGGYNATEFTIPFEWYSACFGSGWAAHIDEDLKQPKMPKNKNVVPTSVVKAIREYRDNPNQPKVQPRRSTKNNTAGHDL